MDTTKLNLDQLKSDVTGALVDGLGDLVKGSKEDVLDFASAISKDLLEARLTGQGQIVDQLVNQLKVLAEINRVRVESHAWVVVTKIVKAVLTAAAAGALAAL